MVHSQEQAEQLGINRIYKYTGTDKEDMPQGKYLIGYDVNVINIGKEKIVNMYGEGQYVATKKCDKKGNLSIFGAYLTQKQDLSNQEVMVEYEVINNENDYYYDYYYYYNQLSNYENRNNYRMPDYHRMDVSVNFHKKLKRGTRTWNISVYNLYNRKNPYIIYEKTGSPYTSPSGQHYSSSLVQLSIFPIIPSVSYTFKF